MNKHGQGALEYLLLLGGILLIVILSFVILRGGPFAQTNEQIACSLGVWFPETSACAEFSNFTIDPSGDNATLHLCRAFSPSEVKIYIYTDAGCMRGTTIVFDGAVDGAFMGFSSDEVGHTIIFLNILGKTLSSLNPATVYYVDFYMGNNKVLQKMPGLVGLPTPPDLTAPTSNSPANAGYLQGGLGTITWALADNVAGGHYQITRNGTIVQDWTVWVNGAPVSISVNTTTVGDWNYTIFYNDSSNNFGIPDEVGITITAAGPCINITLANQTYTAPGTYCLAGDVSSSAFFGSLENGVNFDAGASGSTLYCYGWMFNNTGFPHLGYGIFLNNLSDFTVFNCTATNYQVGFYSNHSTNVTIENSTFFLNDVGIYFNPTVESRIQYNHIYRNGNAASLAGLPDRSPTSIPLLFSPSRRLDFLAPGTYGGIVLEGSSNNNVTSNNASSNAGDGILLIDSTNNRIVENIASNNNDPSSTGIKLTGTSTGNFIINNTANSNLWFGMVFGGGSDSNSLDNNMVCYSGGISDILVAALQIASSSNTCGLNLCWETAPPGGVCVGVGGNDCENVCP